jgi:hypothetical protein
VIQINAGDTPTGQYRLKEGKVMLPERDREYHIRRAVAELDLAYRADAWAAMAAHMRLSALHMARLYGQGAAEPKFR